MLQILFALLLVSSPALSQSRLDQADAALEHVHSWQSLDQWRRKYAPTYDDGYLSEIIADFVEQKFAKDWRSLPKLVALSKVSPGLFKFSVAHLGEITSCDGAKKILENAMKKCPKGYESYCRQIRGQLDTSATAPECLPAQLPPENSSMRTRWGSPLADVHRSHIEANVPSSDVFDQILERDLLTYFRKETGKSISKVKFRLLRDGPTQSGAAYPKYYLWVIVENGEARITEGAVRVAAIDKKRFDVTNFVSKKEIQQGPDRLNFIFPKLLVPSILSSASVQ